MCRNRSRFLRKKLGTRDELINNASLEDWERSNSSTGHHGCKTTKIVEVVGRADLVMDVSTSGKGFLCSSFFV